MKKLVLYAALIATAGLVQAQDNPAPNRAGRPSFEDMDTNKDGKITQDEIQAGQDKRIEERFARFDKNSDGVITKDEIPEMPANSPRARFMPDMSKLDKNGDGKISKEEFAEMNKDGAKEMFTRLDKNGDGAITKEEMEAARAQFRQGRGGPGGGSGGEAKDTK